MLIEDPQFNKMYWSEILSDIISTGMMGCARIAVQNTRSLEEFLQLAETAFKTALEYQEQVYNEYVKQQSQVTPVEEESSE